MALEIEVSLRVPSLTIRALDEEARRIDTKDVRYRKRMTVPAVPKKGESLSVTFRDLEPMDCSVVRTDWDEAKHLFVVACTWGRRSITPSEYQALVGDSDWVSTPLV